MLISGSDKRILLNNSTQFKNKKFPFSKTSYFQYLAYSYLNTRLFFIQQRNLA